MRAQVNDSLELNEEEIIAHLQQVVVTVMVAVVVVMEYHGRILGEFLVKLRRFLSQDVHQRSHSCVTRVAGRS